MGGQVIYSPEASPAWLSLGRSWHEDGWGGARVPGWHREGCLGLQGWGLAGGMAAGEGGESWFPPPLVLLLKGCWLETRHEGQHLKGLQPTLP